MYCVVGTIYLGLPEEHFVDGDGAGLVLLVLEGEKVYKSV